MTGMVRPSFHTTRPLPPSPSSAGGCGHLGGRWHPPLRTHERPLSSTRTRHSGLTASGTREPCFLSHKPRPWPGKDFAPGPQESDSALPLRRRPFPALPGFLQHRF